MLAEAQPIRVQIRTDPITGPWLPSEHPHDASLYAMWRAVPLAHEEMRAHLCCRVNGIEVPREKWRYRRPFVGAPVGAPVFVTFDFRYQGGGEGGGKNTLSVVASIALIGASIAVSGGALGLLGVAALGPGTIGAALAGAAIGIGGDI